ncbi:MULTISPECIES: DUF397 domain-containing protein [unclassified Streptomyces]|uniref:DUF397 domain-containing protein n=1 Tax=unclassified Streptomyces TaxID=2593676 RepID=UPI0005B8376C|nr:DUF397 domain-containing protein [Streptomyces sp. Tu6071]ASY34173.1 DUF397 domain-containing protein [Streptomyces sp. CLI2509]MYX22763.1 DUF397 domain-containing protein [Streptomyces sp. SID8380]
MNHQHDDPQHPTWIRSPYSGTEGNCVEVATSRGRLAVRDSKDLASPHLGFSPTAWQHFLDGAHI